MTSRARQNREAPFSLRFGVYAKSQSRAPPCDFGYERTAVPEMLGAGGPSAFSSLSAAELPSGFVLPTGRPRFLGAWVVAGGPGLLGGTGRGGALHGVHCGFGADMVKRLGDSDPELGAGWGFGGVRGLAMWTPASA